MRLEKLKGSSQLPVSAAKTRPRFEAVYAAHLELVERTLSRLGVRPANLDDATQEVFLVVHRQLPQFEGRSQLKTWIFGICRHVALDASRRQKRETTFEAAPEPKHSGELALRTVQRQQEHRLLTSALHSLPSEKRAVFELYTLHETPMQDVASSLGVPLQTAYARLYSAQRQVGEKLNAQAPIPDRR